jgi:integrase
MVRYLLHAQDYYRRPDGTMTSEVAEFKTTFRILKALYASTTVNQFGPLALETVRNKMIEAGWCRNLINKRIGRIRRFIKWAVAKQYAKPDTLVALQAVSDLAMGRSKARESKPVRPVAPDLVAATLPKMSRHIGAMVRVQLLTSARPGEVCNLCGRDIDATRNPWIFRPRQHKTAYRNRHRTIYIGPDAQEILKPFLKSDPDAYLFNPAEARAEFDTLRRQRRKSKVTPSQAARTIPRASPAIITVQLPTTRPSCGRASWPVCLIGTRTSSATLRRPSLQTDTARTSPRRSSVTLLSQACRLRRCWRKPLVVGTSAPNAMTKITQVCPTNGTSLTSDGAANVRLNRGLQ